MTDKQSAGTGKALAVAAVTVVALGAAAGGALLSQGGTQSHLQQQTCHGTTISPNGTCK